MTKIIAFHSFRRGAGISNLLASCAMLLAMDGKRVGVIDTDFQSPSDHVLFPVTAMLPHTEEMLTLAGKGILQGNTQPIR